MNLLVFSVGLFVLVLVIVLVHYFSMLGFLHKMWHKSWNEPKETFEPKTAVILALRGADPFLTHCIQGLLTQNYSNYTVFFVFDSPTDPALAEVEKIVQNCTNRSPGCSTQTIIVDEFPGTCSLRCNSATYTIERLDESFEVIAITDADACTYPTWLRQLVEPLSDSRFMATSGLIIASSTVFPYSFTARNVPPRTFAEPGPAATVVTPPAKAIGIALSCA